ncbi:MAG TPA: hypothetical protein VHC72_06530 [Bryobacteraceae bacterium]|nr:hypothetical protein [Bryobacteraceae bacterium]
MAARHPKKGASPAGGRFTRRQLAGVAAGSLAVSLGAVALAQTPAPPEDWDKIARESHRDNSEELASFEIPISLEPAFHFKA